MFVCVFSYFKLWKLLVFRSVQIYLSNSFNFRNFATCMIDQETIQRIKDAARIEEVVGEFVSLRKRGANYIGCCPFHTEKTPSFNVNPARGIFKCFGCGEAGDVVSFLMKHEHYTYPEALHYLADKYNITIEEEVLTPEAQQIQSERDALFHVSDFAQKYFADQLFNDEMGKAVGLSYFHNRGMSDVVIRNFGLGYCPEGWTTFYDHAHKNGYSDAVLEKTGLTVIHESGKKSDRFHGRVAFPIYSISGRVLGFSCRTLSKEKNVAKYVNSPESEIYIKGNILYGLYQAKNAISKNDKCYLVEGNVDVVSMHQSGVTNTVASCGTALTTNQIRLIRRYTPNVTVLYDGDAAGIHATIKAVNLLFAEGMHVRVVLFPDGDDPDSYAQKYGSAQLQQYLQEHEENFLLYRARQVSDIIRHDPIRKADLLKEIAATIALVPDMVERSEYITQCASLFQTSEASLSNSVSQALVSNAQKEYKEAQKNKNAETVEQGSETFGNKEVVTQRGDQWTQGADTVENAPVILNAVEEIPQERQIISLLINRGTELVPAGLFTDTPELPQEPTDNKDATEEQSQYTFAQVIVYDLLADEIEFENPVFQTIFNLYADAVAENKPLPDANYFASHADNSIRNTALDMMVSRYHISPIWKERNVPGCDPDRRKGMDLRESLYIFKIKKIDTRIGALEQRIRQPQNDEDMMIALDEKNQLLHIRREFAQRLNRVIG